MAESGIEVGGDLRAVLDGADQRSDAIARGQVVQRDEDMALKVGGVDRPGGAG